MSVDFQIPKGRLLPILTATLSDASGPINLTGATVRFQMRAPGSSDLQVDAAAAIVGPAVNGQVSYTWVAADVDTPALYIAWFEVAYAGPKPLNAPEPPMTIEVTRGAG